MRKINSQQADKGGLLIRCTTNSQARPLDGANISIFGTDDGGNEVKIEELQTDSSGRTEEITLGAPPVDYSLAPNSPRPYSLYNLRITADGFESLIIKDVQILPDSVALQNCELQSKLVFAQQQESILISPHTLYYEYPPKIPEDAVKPLPDPTGFVVLDKVVVPETIVVHDGPPDANAANYYVPFREYIKNVASSEIYSTWPEASIKANVLAIISLTLNRVFTEWYRNKGKNFTITSSTAYDQKYVHGRNIFSQINDAVDEIFTTYITKPDIRQPLFAQYCDGDRVKREGWLHQWGSKALADKGYTPINILRNYYGSSVYLDSAEKVAGIPQSYPGYSLKIGSSGDAVRTIQNQLNSIANNYPALGKVAADGVFGQSTAVTVKKFQEIFNLPPDGIVGFSTWYKISEIYVAVNKLAATWL